MINHLKDINFSLYDNLDRVLILVTIHIYGLDCIKLVLDLGIIIAEEDISKLPASQWFQYVKSIYLNLIFIQLIEIVITSLCHFSI